ncbi:MAG: hypothetical protein GF416_03270 [Candidatus Altiarchaeales archaeon]|nr:hypothetical protein [Candidatus Altiarchaeales archaeon]MBD3416139.1 hypothetical protein [Candidatus Altiarchaeales archaeon]
MKARASILLLALLCGCVTVEERGEVSSCDGINDTYWRDICHMTEAVNSSNSTICEKIEDQDLLIKCLKKSDFLFEADTTTTTVEAATSTTVKAVKSTTQKAAPSTSTTATTTSTTSTTLEATVDVYFLDVGYGDSTLVVTSNTTMLTDCGPSANRLKRILDDIGVERIDYLLVSQPTIEDYGGCWTLMDTMDVVNVLDTGQEALSDRNIYVRYRGYAQLSEHTLVSEGYTLSFDGVDVTVLHPAETKPTSGRVTENALVYKLTYSDNTILMTGDCDGECLGSLEGDLSADILKVPRHGAKQANTEEFISRVGPELAVVTPWKDRKEYPSPETLDILSDAGVDVFNIMDGNTVKVTLRGAGYEVEPNLLFS